MMQMLRELGVWRSRMCSNQGSPSPSQILGGGRFPLWPPRGCHNTHFWEFCAHASDPIIYYTLTTLGHPWHSIWPPNDAQVTGQIVLWIKVAPPWWQKWPWWHQNDPRILPQVHQMTPKTSQMTSNVTPITPKSALRPCTRRPENERQSNMPKFCRFNLCIRFTPRTEWNLAARASEQSHFSRWGAFL